MNPLKRIAFIGNSLPRRCGIATFTTDLQQAVSAAYPHLDTCIIAMTDHGHSYAYPTSVAMSIDDQRISDYHMAADFLNTNHYDIVSLQHEFGIFGGEAGKHIMALLSRLTMPIVTTLHTVLAHPSEAQRAVMDQIIAVSSRLIVMAEKGRALLRTVYGVADNKIDVIPHGIPDVPFAESDAAKAKLGYEDKSVILTFGLLTPNKGIEVMIDAMPAILQKSPNAHYVVLGATHPNLVRQHGELYRDSLFARARDLGVENQVVFLDQFVDKSMLLDFIAMCDVYVTPYLNESQMTSGTLAYSFGMGKPVVSTPYWHAQELLADGNGLLVPFSDACALAEAIGGLLTDDKLRLAMRARAYDFSRSMTWANVARDYVETFEDTQAPQKLRLISGIASQNNFGEKFAIPPMQLEHFMAMCDDTGLMQHAIHAVPDRAHGYCIDDNARALLLACALNAPGERPLPDSLVSKLAAFIQHAWNPGTRRFRNFMGYDRRWLEDSGSEDSHGRTLWALGVCARSDASASRRLWAKTLFAEAMSTLETFNSPRTWAFGLLGLNAYCSVVSDDLTAMRLRRSLAAKLMALLSKVETSEWTWFEAGLAYDNARLPQALIETGSATGMGTQVEAGLRTLRWLNGKQTTSSGLFRPVGTAGFGDQHKSPPQPFDQQPVDAVATMAACLSAWRVTGEASWRAEAARAFAWYFGRNDLGLPLVDIEAGRCRDGLHPDRVNENCGAESVLSYLASVAEMRQAAQMEGELARSLSSVSFTNTNARNLTQLPRGHVDTNSISEPSGALFAARSNQGGGAPIQARDGTEGSQPHR